MKLYTIHQFKVLSSTNYKAKQFIEKGFFNFIIVADKQTKGRGRFGREWVSKSGGLYMTIALKENNVDMVQFLTFIAAISVAKTITKITGLKAELKWPNDVLVDNKKVCGILTETNLGKNSFVLIGIGVNVNQKEFKKSLNKIATSIFLEIKKKISINKFINVLMDIFEKQYYLYKNKKFNLIRKNWKDLSHTIDKKIKVKTLKGDFVGKAIDIDKNGNLILKKNGSRITITEGDIYYI